MPRPKLDPAIMQRIVDLVRAGNFLDVAAAACGIHKTTLHRWKRLGGQQKRGKYRKLLEALERAQAESEARDVATIAKAGGTDWRAAAWRLERRSPKRYGQRLQLLVQEELEDVLDRLQRHLKPEIYEQVLLAMSRDDDELTEPRDVTPLRALTSTAADGE